ncbi:hypothetical protein [Segniliparus rugosus]|uniref:Trypsin n=1 Tax=Segniliparus rugosus (strain ATCC BAA-974 / DSM 45345 / CCUG 50838 / CIP 108380 / JCM 13579 / CDC 945) TaxID=679197 RepID=E5XMS6_SEGRC|nr:hypothetical protein [Segniliparus rugosus]EFV14346.1 hypothetical protein HMPREF9336_00796 [Segniliparus rugosus ATCC BAA-974]
MRLPTIALALAALAALLSPAAASAMNAAEDVTPAVTIAQDTDNTANPSLSSQNDRAFCTLGFLARLPDGRTGAVTAGHCDNDAPGSPGWVHMAYSPTDTWRRFAHFVAKAYGDDAGSDIALLAVDPSAGIPTDARIGYKLDVRGYVDAATLAATAPKACKWGAVTGMTCGDFIGVVPGTNKAQWRMASAHGDSGSPVFVSIKSGGVGAVGVLDGSPRGDDGVVTVELIEPWLSKWGLQLL